MHGKLSLLILVLVAVLVAVVGPRVLADDSPLTEPAAITVEEPQTQTQEASVPESTATSEPLILEDYDFDSNWELVVDYPLHPMEESWEQTKPIIEHLGWDSEIQSVSVSYGCGVDSMPCFIVDYVTPEDLPVAYSMDHYTLIQEGDTETLEITVTIYYVREGESWELVSRDDWVSVKWVKVLK